ncbi:UNVERIFIED_CONTAM: hypothetical protein Sindi_0197600, partial [Sesamum indicum]
DLDHLLGKVRSPPIEAAIDSIVGDILGEGAARLKVGDSLLATDAEPPPPPTSLNVLDSQPEKEKKSSPVIKKMMM